MDLRGQVESEASAAKDAVPRLTDEAVAAALEAAAGLVGERRRALLDANRDDVVAAARLDPGTLDRLRLDDSRVDALAGQLAAMARADPLEREAGAWTLPNGLQVAELARLAAGNGVRTLAHAEGGGVLYVHAAAARERALAIAEASIDRLGVCNRLNLLLIDRAVPELAGDLVELLARRGIAVRDELGREWANDANPSQVTICYLDSIEEALRLANEETSGLAAGIVTEDEAAARTFLDGYRGTAGFWNVTTRFTDGFALTGAPETGINVDETPGPRGPVTYRDLWLRQYRVVGDGTQTR